MIRLEDIVGGRSVAGNDSFESFDPYTGKSWALIPKQGKAEVEEAVAAARSAFDAETWRGLTPSARAKLLNRLADLIAANAERLAEIEARDNAMRIAREEVCGSVLSITPFDDEDEAYAIANDSPYGLAAGTVWIDTKGETANPFVIR